MSEHQFNNIYWLDYVDAMAKTSYWLGYGNAMAKASYWLGYGDAMAKTSRRRSWPKVTVLIIVVAGLAFWAGRMSMKSRVASAYEAGFETGTAERSTNWEEWR